MTTIFRQYYEDKLTRLLEPWALRHLVPALDGDVDAAFSLMCAAGNDKRGMLAVDFWRIKTAVPAYQALLSAAWGHDHRQVIVAAGSRRTLRAMFRYAAFTLPDLPDVVRVWRGTSAITKKQAARGISWTLDRDVACWFAMRFAENKGKPLVLAVDVPKAAIVHFGDAPQEREVVVFDVLGAWVDGTIEDWELAHRRKESEIRAEKAARLMRITRKRRNTGNGASQRQRG